MFCWKRGIRMAEKKHCKLKRKGNEIGTTIHGPQLDQARHTRSQFSR